MPEQERRLILVAGMHRSGTSAVARVLNLLGAEIPGELVPESEDNPRGHWEPRALVELHDAMLRSAGSNVNSVFPVDDAWFASSAADEQVERLADFLDTSRPDEPLALVKDPRIALFLPIWRRALDRVGISGALVFPFRDPLEVAASLQRRQQRFFPDSPWPPGRGVLIWLRYVLEAERHSRGLPRSFVAYDALLIDWETEAQRIARQLKLQWPASAATEIDAFLSRELKHQNRPHPAHPPTLSDRVLKRLHANVQDPDAGAQAFDEARAQLDGAAALFRDYVEAIELTLGSNPRLRTEFIDFLAARQSHPAEGAGESADALASYETADPERREALVRAARGAARVQAERIAELELFNQALLEAARLTEGVRSAEFETARQARDHAQAVAEDARRQLADVQSAHAQAEAQRAFATHELQRVRGELLAAETRAEALASETAAGLADLERSRGRVRQLEVDLLARAEETRRLQDEIDRLASDNAGLAQALAAARSAAEALEASRTWRLTAPARALARSLGAARKRS